MFAFVAFVCVCLRLSTFARVRLRLLAFSTLRLLASVSVCLRLFAFARICLHPPLLRPPLRDTDHSTSVFWAAEFASPWTGFQRSAGMITQRSAGTIATGNLRKR